MPATTDIAPGSLNAIEIPSFTVMPGNPSVIVPADEYILGDPSYTVPGDAWDSLLESCDFFDEATPVGTAMGFPILAFFTAHGDGVYLDEDGNEYSVDAGLIGLVPASLQNRQTHEWMTYPPRRVTFSSPARCWACDGLLRFGHITIDTKLI